MLSRVLALRVLSGVLCVLQATEFSSSRRRLTETDEVRDSTGIPMSPNTPHSDEQGPLSKFQLEGVCGVVGEQLMAIPVVDDLEQIMSVV
jgi:hypothetical protein